MLAEAIAEATAWLVSSLVGAGQKRWDMVELLKQLSEAAQEDASAGLDLSQYVRAGRTNTQEQQHERLQDAHRIFDLQVRCGPPGGAWSSADGT